MINLYKKSLKIPKG